METPGHGVIVVDTNILAYLLIKGDQTEKARRLLDRDRDWIAPSFWRIEFLNVLINYAHYQSLAFKEAKPIWEASFRLTHLREEAVEAGHALDLAMKHKITGYDALFVALAQNLKTVCVTQDKALRKAVPHLTASLDEFLK
jgi:predicted nucleic acid-binding protein